LFGDLNPTGGSPSKKSEALGLTRPVPLDWRSGAVLSFPTAFDVDSVPPPKCIPVDRAGGFYGNHPR
jgi:hypothetical protein